MWSNKQKMIALLVVVAVAMTAFAMYKKSCACATTKPSTPAVADKKVTIVEPSVVKADSEIDTTAANKESIPEPMLA